MVSFRPKQKSPLKAKAVAASPSIAVAVAAFLLSTPTLRDPFREKLFYIKKINKKIKYHDDQTKRSSDRIKRRKRGTVTRGLDVVLESLSPAAVVAIATLPMSIATESDAFSIAKKP